MGEEPVEEEEPVEVTDVFGVEDVCDIGKGKPLFAEFAAEDWALLTLRYELHTLAHAVRIDVNDVERPGLHTELLVFYYQKYFGRQLNVKDFGVDSVPGLVQLVQDVIFIDSSSILQSQLPDTLESADVLMKLTEECRRDREMRLTLDDPTAKLSIKQSLGGKGGAVGKGGQWNGSNQGIQKQAHGGYGPQKGGQKGFREGPYQQLQGGWKKGGGKG